MSIKSVIACCKYQLSRMRFIPIFFAVWSIGSILFTAIIRSIIDKVPFSLAGTGSGGYDLLMGAIIFGYMCFFMTDFLNTAAANGASRTTACVSAYISSIICSFVSALEVSVFSPIVSLISGEEEIWGASLYGYIGALQEAGWDMLSIKLRFFGICLVYYIALSTMAILLVSIVYRFPKWVSALIIITMIFIPTAGIYMTLGKEAFASFWYSIVKLLGLKIEHEWLIGNALQGAAVCIGSSLVLLLLSCLITRRSSVKPLAIKSD